MVPVSKKKENAFQKIVEIVKTGIQNKCNDYKDFQVPVLDLMWTNQTFIRTF